MNRLPATDGSSSLFSLRTQSWVSCRRVSEPPGILAGLRVVGIFPGKCWQAAVAAMRAESESHAVGGPVSGSDRVRCPALIVSGVHLASCVYPCHIFPLQKRVLILRMVGLQVTTKVFLGSTAMNPLQRLVRMPLLETSGAITAWLAGLLRSDFGFQTVECIQAPGLS